TYTLEHLVVELLLSTEATLDQILVVTFTERAAAELKTRLRSKLRRMLDDPLSEGEAREAGHVRSAAQSGEAPAAVSHPQVAPLKNGEPSWVIDGAAQQKLNRALMDFDRASISTIHAFCQRMLLENAFVVERLFRQELVDGKAAFARSFMRV